jgi:hypothetical protein
MLNVFQFRNFILMPRLLPEQANAATIPNRYRLHAQNDACPGTGQSARERHCPVYSKLTASAFIVFENVL